MQFASRFWPQASYFPAPPWLMVVARGVALQKKHHHEARKHERHEPEEQRQQGVGVTDSNDRLG